MFDLIAEFLFDAIGELFESGAETAAEAAAETAAETVTDVSMEAALGAGDVALDPGALAAPVEAAGGGASFEFDDHPYSATLRSAGFSGPV